MIKPIHRPLLNFIRRLMRERRKPIPVEDLWPALENSYNQQPRAWMKEMSEKDWSVELLNLTMRERINIIEGSIHDICLTERKVTDELVG